jgi:shikimate kinase
MVGHVVLVGPMGSGKTTIGRALADRLGVAHVDTDDLVEAAAGVSVADVFATEHEAGFRARERVALAEALRGVDAVISTGGGMVTGAANRERLGRPDAFVVWLDPPIDELVARVGDGSGRPLLAGGVRAALARTVAERRPHYAAVADLRLDTGAHDVAGCVDAIVRARDEAVV